MGQRLSDDKNAENLVTLTLTIRLRSPTEDMVFKTTFYWVAYIKVMYRYLIIPLGIISAKLISIFPAQHSSAVTASAFHAEGSEFEY